MLLPVGYDNFREIIEKKQFVFIDKTLFIKEVLDDSATKVAVITRPRRFGKTLNLSMLHHYLAADVGGSSTEGLFENLKISQCGDEYLQHKGKYPVIFVSFKNIEGASFKDAYSAMETLMRHLYRQYYYLLDSPKLRPPEKKAFNLIVNKKADFSDVKAALYDLTYYLNCVHGVKPWLLIDEYDAPIQAAYAKGYYQEMTDFMRGLLGTALKTNPYLERGVITGILRIAKESFFSGLNNLQVYSLLDDEYSQHFGFTEPEIEAILMQANLADKADEIKSWYNGYQMGDTIVYNPWSIANCIKKRGELKTYWVNAGQNQLVKTLLKNSSLNFKEQFEQLMQGKTITYAINENMVFHYLNASPTSVWTLLLMSGYLKPLSSQYTSLGTECELAIPNREVRDLYSQIIAQLLSNSLDIEWFKKFIESLVNGDMDTFKEGLNNIILQITSYHDFTKQPEAFFHGLMLGFVARLHNNGYEVQSNKESGQGRYDIMIVPDDRTKLGIVIELKNFKSDPKKNNKNQNLIKLAKDALKQIDDKKYPETLKQHGITNILKIGIGFCGKEFELVSSKESP